MVSECCEKKDSPRSSGANSMSASEPNLTGRGGGGGGRESSRVEEPQGLLETFAAMALRRGPVHPPQPPTNNMQQSNNVNSNLFPRYVLLSIAPFSELLTELRFSSSEVRMRYLVLCD